MGKNLMVPKIDRFLALLLKFIVISTTGFLSACYDLTRFKQERYECGLNPYGLVELDFRDFDPGSTATVMFNDTQRKMPILSSNEKVFVLSADGLLIRVDRVEGTVRLTKGTHYQRIECSKTEFRM